MHCFHLIVGIFILTQSVIKCSQPDPELHSSEYNNVIVKAINDFRGKLMCSKHVIGLKYISENANLIKAAQDILNKKSKDDNPSHLKQITPETCDYKINSEYGTLDCVHQFIDKCLNRTNDLNNLKLDWLWNPSITTIGCAFKKGRIFVIFCVVNEVAEKIELEKQNNLLDEAKSTMDLNTKPCIRTKLEIHSKIKTCFFRQESRELIIKELNILRNGLAVERNYTNLNYVEWDYDLEKTAIELKRFNITAIRESACFINKKFKSTYLVHKRYNFNMTSDLYIDLIPNWFKELKQKALAESDDPSNISRPLGWIYDAEFQAIGCTLFKQTNYVHTLCLTNRDPEQKFNLLNGIRFCDVVLDCECRNKQYPYLCAPKSNAIHLKYYDMYIIYGSIILIYACIIVFIIFIRSVSFFEKQQSLFESDY